MPVINSTSGYIPNIASRLPSNLQSSLVLPEPIRLTEWRHGPAIQVRMERFECIDLLEKIKISLVAAFEGLVCFLAAKDVHGAL